MTPVTYPQLIFQAATLIEQGRRSAGIRLDDRDTALALVADRHAVLSALEGHIWAVLGPGRAAGAGSAMHPGPVEAAAQNLASQISQTIGADRPHPSLLGGVDTTWRRAAQTIRAASDLLTVHHDRTGAPRTPTAHLLETITARDAALTQVAALTVSTAAVEDTLALRVGQTGVPWPTVRALLPGMQAVTQAAEALTNATGTANLTGLPDVGLIPTQVRTTDALDELTDHLTRVRQRAWEQVNSPDRSVATLRDLATIAVAVHAHSAAFHSGPDGPAPRLLARAQRWQDLSRNLATLVSPAPVDDVVHDDLIALARLLPAVAPLDGRGRATSPDLESRRTGATLGGAVALMAEIAGHSSRTFAKVIRQGGVYAPARVLTGAEITNRPDLITARLNGTLVAAPRRLLDDVARGYQALRDHPVPTISHDHAVARAVDVTNDVEPIARQVGS